MTSVAFLVSGRVQGVGFRMFTRSVARTLNICGWVRNEPNGKVCGSAQGDTLEMDKFLEALKIGPPMSNVKSVDVSDNEVGEYSSFDILF